MCAAAAADVSIHSWAASLTHHHMRNTHHQPLTPQHFSVLTQDKKFASVLTYLVRHVRPLEEQRIIKLNLKHASFRKHLSKGEAHEWSEEEGAGLEGQLRLRAALLDANTAITAEVKEIHLLNQRLEEGHQKECEARRVAATLAAARQQGEAAIQRYQCWSHQLEDLKQQGVEQGGEAGGATSVAVQRQLKANLSDIENFHHTTITDQLHSPGDVHQQKVQLWESVGGSLGKLGPRPLLGALIGETRGATRGLHSLLQNVHLNRDARELRLKCEKDGTFIDERNPGGVVKGVRELLHLMCASHVQLYLCAHKDNTHAASLTRALNTLKNNITVGAKRSYSDESVSACVVEVAQKNIALAGERAALETTLALISDLQQRATQATRTREAVRAKHERILTFDRKVQEALNTIHSMAWAVKEGWPEIQEGLGQLQASIVSSLSLLTTPTPAPPHPLATEGEAYTTLPLAYLLTINCDGLGLKRKAHLSTTSLLWHQYENGETGWEVVCQLRPGVSSWEAIYQAVCHYLAQTHVLHAQLDHIAFLRVATQRAEKVDASGILSSQEMKKLKKEVEEHDQRQKVLLCLAKDYEKEVAEGLQLVDNVTKLLHDWWEQPAKNIPVKK